MIGLGKYNPLPMRVGGGTSTIEVIHKSLLDKYEPGWAVHEETIKYAEAYAEALAIAHVWSVNARVSYQFQPMKMLDWLPDFETACDTRPTEGMTLVDRRKRVLAKMRGAAGNTLGDIYDVCRIAAGRFFVNIHTVDEIETVTYWPGINPGPPGLEWSSTRYVVGVEVSQSAPEEETYESIYRAVDVVAPAWVRVVLGKTGDFSAGISLVGETIL